jgi:tetratricopeptide (TPR) repeat protein
MAKKKKLSRKKLLKEPDEFITLSGRMIQFAMTHKTHITYGVGIVIALAAIIAGYRFFAARSENKSLALFDRAVIKYEASLKSQDLRQAYESVFKDFRVILDKYGNKGGGKLARVTFANICFDAGEYGEAIKLYEASLKNFEHQPMVYNLILIGLGYANGQLNENQRAVTYFQKIVERDDQILRDEALFNLGILYEKLGEMDKSKNAFDQITSDFPESMYIDIIKERTAS